MIRRTAEIRQNSKKSQRKFVEIFLILNPNICLLFSIFVVK